MGELSPWHWAVVVLIALLLFGSRRLPDAARSLGRSARILRAELKGLSDDRAADGGTADRPAAADRPVPADRPADRAVAPADGDRPPRP